MNREQMISHLVLNGWEPVSSGIWFGIICEGKGALTYYRSDDVPPGAALAWEVSHAERFDMASKDLMYKHCDHLVNGLSFDWCDIDARMLQPLFYKAITL